MSHLKLLDAITSTVITLIITAAMSHAATIYDSGGFEAPRFVAVPTANNLAGQDPTPAGQGPWQQDAGTSTAVVQTNTPQAGLQAVEVQRLVGATGDTRWFVTKPVTPTPASSVINIDFDMSVNIPAVLTHGPLFGVEAYDASSATPKLVGGLLLDAAQGTVLYDLTGTGAPTATDTFLTRNAYHHFTLSADFFTHDYSIYADGNLLHTESFVDPTASAFTYAPIAALAFADPSETSKAFFDNYTITQTSIVPEPGCVALFAVAGMTLRIRRRTPAACGLASVSLRTDKRR